MRLLHTVAGAVGSRPTETPSKTASPPPLPIVQPNVDRSSQDSRRPPAPALDIGLGRPSLESRQGNTFDLRRRPSPNDREMPMTGSSTSPERTEATNTATTTPSADFNSSPSPSPEAEAITTFEDPQSRYRTWQDGGSMIGKSKARLMDEDRTIKLPSLRIIESSGDGSGFGAGVSPALRTTTGAQARSRKRSMSVQEKMGGRPGRFLLPAAGMLNNGENSGVPSRPGSSLSAGRISRGEANETNSGSGGLAPKPEWLGPRTAKAFRAAGLIDHDREKGSASVSGNDSLDRLRERSGSVVGVLAPSPLGNGGSGLSSGINRFASLRGSSDYNHGNRSHSRMAFSEVGGSGGLSSRRGSESISAYSGGNGIAYGLMESPTFSYSGSSGSRGERERDRDRDTPKSTTTSSTALTSLSESFGYFGRDRERETREREREKERDREWDEIRELKEKHATEVAALLSALSDSQRTARMLREENSGLRERLERVSEKAREGEEVRRVYERLKVEFEGLRRECGRSRRESRSMSMSVAVPAPAGMAMSWSGSSATTNISSGLRTPKLVTSSPLATDVTSRFYQDEYKFNDTVIIHDNIDDDDEPFRRRTFLDADVDLNDKKDHDDGDDDDETRSPLNVILPNSESTPSINRRLSSTSSIFPVPPPNMTMLLDVDDDDNAPLLTSNSNRSSTDHSHYMLSLPTSSSHRTSMSIPTPIPKSISTSHSPSGPSPPVTFKNFVSGVEHAANTSSVSVSPTTADFSIVTSSPRSLFLRPEHELLLGDMESLDLGGVVPPIEMGQHKDDW